MVRRRRDVDPSRLEVFASVRPIHRHLGERAENLRQIAAALGSEMLNDGDGNGKPLGQRTEHTSQGVQPTAGSGEQDDIKACVVGKHFRVFRRATAASSR
jgi:hypothetical protein